MKRKVYISIAALTLLAMLVNPVQLTARHTRYKLVVIGTFGGPNSFPFFEDAKALTNRGSVVGQADTAIPDPNFANFDPYVGQNPFLQHAFKWQNGTLTNLGALPGADTTQVGWISEGGLATGLSTRSSIDPITGWPEEAAILWKKGEMIDLGTLGGYEAQADANNSRGQVAGFSANAVPDSFPAPICMMRDLGDLGGPDAVALVINEHLPTSSIAIVIEARESTGSPYRSNGPNGV